MIQTPEELQSLIDRARSAAVVALDTEFVWERTFYPRLGVVQLGIDRDDVTLIDAAALDLAPLADLLADEKVVKLFHDAEQDLTILRRASGGSPRNIFDTQRAAGFVGLGASVSLQGLIEGLLGIRLDKGATRSDWMQRPLSAEQVSYALDDVRYLPDAYRQLQDRLQRLGRVGWVEEEMAHYDDPARYEEDDPRERYQNVRGRGKRGFGGRDYAVLRELAAWREEEARRRDRPRGHIVSDDALLELAQRAPGSADRLGKMRKLSGKDVDRYGEAILAAVARGRDVPASEYPDRPARSAEDHTLTPRLDLVQALIRGRGQRDGVDPALIGNRADVERLVAEGTPDPADHRILQGWRREFIGADLEALLLGQAAVTLDDEGLPQFLALTSR